MNIGASDAYLSSSDMTQYPGLQNIPLTVAAVDVNYNVTGVKKPLNLNGTVLAGIYTGKITMWNDSAIAKLNPGVSLPAEKIVTLHRADSSGSTFLFTSYLSAQDPSAWSSSNIGTTITWPSAPGALAETGSGGMLSACGTTKGCIAYLGISYLTKATTAGLGTASLADKSGTYEAPTTATITSALGSFPAPPASGARVADQQLRRLPDHQLRVRDREEDPAKRSGSYGGQEVPELGAHYRQQLDLSLDGRLPAAAGVGQRQ